MPIYEFRCRACGKTSSVLVRSLSRQVTPSCSACGGPDLVRLMGRFAYHKSIQTIHEESGEPTLLSGSDYYKDPRNIGRWAEKRFSEMGEEMPPHLKNMIAAAREGELPDSMKDLKTPSPDAAFS